MKLTAAVFVDRDGTIIHEREYLSDPDGLELIPGAVEALRSLREAGFRLVTVTNQSGIARGLYTLDDYHAVAERLTEALEEEGVRLDGTWYCPHHPDVTGACACRKPGTGMYLEAGAELGLDLSASYYVGDKLTDVMPGLELGGHGILVRTGYGHELEAQAPKRVRVVDDLRAAAAMIREDSGR